MPKTRLRRNESPPNPLPRQSHANVNVARHIDWIVIGQEAGKVQRSVNDRRQDDQRKTDHMMPLFQIRLVHVVQFHNHPGVAWIIPCRVDPNCLSIKTEQLASGPLKGQSVKMIGGTRVFQRLEAAADHGIGPSSVASQQERTAGRIDGLCRPSDSQ